MEKKTIKAAATKSVKSVKPIVQPKEEKPAMTATAKTEQHVDTASNVYKMLMSGKPMNAIRQAIPTDKTDERATRSHEALTDGVSLVSIAKAIAFKNGGFNQKTKEDIINFCLSHYGKAQTEKYCISRGKQIFSGARAMCKRDGTIG
jgi:hypothetical protein